jgi:PTH1 family peptidyl-tRNA hydrolase
LKKRSNLHTSETFLIVGLGNPGAGYSHNRHNVGQMALDVLAARMSVSFKAHKAGAAVAEGRLGEHKLILAKPATFMNVSGRPVAALMKFYSIEASHLIVLHDELDIDAAVIRLKQGGGHAGHNGLRDIIAAIGTNDFSRVRIGIGRPPGQMQTADFVLQNFGTVERKELPVTLEIAADAVEAIVADGVAKASARFHTT